MSLSIQAANAGVNVSLLGTIGAAIGGVGGFVTGGVAGAVAGATAGRRIGDAVSGGATPGGPPANPIPTGGFIGLGSGISSTGGKPACALGDFAGALAGTCAPFGIGATPTPAAGCMKGYHLNKHALGATKRHGAVPAHSVLVRNRHMNAGNARAATRAIHRLKAAHRIFKKIDRIVGRHRSAPRRRFGKR